MRVWCPGHPVANADGYALEHRKVLYDAGVDLPPRTHVHHRNGDKTDNRIENLQVKRDQDHPRDHAVERGFTRNQFGTFPLRQERDCETCGQRFMPDTAGRRFCSRICANRR